MTPTSATARWFPRLLCLGSTALAACGSAPDATSASSDDLSSALGTAYCSVPVTSADLRWAVIDDCNHTPSPRVARIDLTTGAVVTHVEHRGQNLTAVGDAFIYVEPQQGAFVVHKRSFATDDDVVLRVEGPAPGTFNDWPGNKRPGYILTEDGKTWVGWRKGATKRAELVVLPLETGATATIISLDDVPGVRLWGDPVPRGLAELLLADARRHLAGRRMA